MVPNMNSLTLPDIAAQATRQALPLEWVGMHGIALPVLLEGQRLSAKADAGVSLDDGEARGIHMSRLYLALEALEQENLSPALLQQVLEEFSGEPRRFIQQCLPEYSHRFAAEETGIDQSIGRLEILSSELFPRA